ncbi:hypothetical protein KJY73_18175 [Bowmanella sp. Y26]|uniref:hypothetical protein n=1 Tax=Bowmanella yangjiangensis TaxID=2811230 RepID=UPI001BDDC840|nr:hypothetical protein [Bowmanella yangjiangensis]MBT1065520.1 hypothetical protein [Bowmanella yangjiangensis]
MSIKSWVSLLWVALILPVKAYASDSWQGLTASKYQLLLTGTTPASCAFSDQGCANNSELAPALRFFVEMAKARQAGEGKPRIGIVTAASPTQSTANLVSLFEQAGATAIWLPLSGAYQLASQLEKSGVAACSQLIEQSKQPAQQALNVRARQTCQNPQNLLADIQSLQGLYIAEGNLLQAVRAFFRPDGSASAELTLIRRMVQADRMAVSASGQSIKLLSGGIQQHPVPMLVSGSTEQAFRRGAFSLPLGCIDKTTCMALHEDDLVYLPQGGLGLFDLGILDTKLSEQDGQGRLALLSMHSGTRFGFGLDEQAALLVGWRNQSIDLHVAGQSGVYIIDSAQGIYKLQGGKRQLVAMSHYLNPGDSATYQLASQAWQFKLTGHALQMQKSSGIWRTTLDSNCKANQPLRWQLGSLALVAMPSEETKFRRAGQTCSYHDLPFGIEN